MEPILRTPERALGAGLVLVVLIGLVLVLAAKVTITSVVLLLARVAHVFVAMIWVGLIWFVNKVQLTALNEADDAGKAAVNRWIVPRVSAQFRSAANLTIATGFLLAVLLGYLARWPVGAAWWLWIGTGLGVVMLGFVHAKIAPALRVILDPSETEPTAKVAARATVRFYARCNLLLALPVTVAMLAAAHA
jgi:hypothetical protein